MPKKEHDEAFQMKSQMMESEMMSLRSKIDELELKLGTHPSTQNLAVSSKGSIYSYPHSQYGQTALDVIKRVVNDNQSSTMRGDDTQRFSNVNLLNGEYGDYLEQKRISQPPLRIEDLPPQMSGKSNKSRSRMS